uniref:Uncharacterized protein n=1 Tax=Timema cristinae TaxID=61476 RepID=A0A7R9DRW5_TIMCR|nr:unnamed protein product [Timema cristinae]
MHVLNIQIARQQAESKEGKGGGSVRPSLKSQMDVRMRNSKLPYLLFPNL